MSATAIKPPMTEKDVARYNALRKWATAHNPCPDCGRLRSSYSPAHNGGCELAKILSLPTVG